MSKVTPMVTELPHDWTFGTWPTTVFPYDSLKARHIVRQHQDDLLRCGALARIGHTLVIFSAGYTKWLASKASRVASDYRVAANGPEHAHKRFGGKVATRPTEAK